MIKKIEEGIYPADIKKMDIGQLELLSYEIRDTLISTVSDTGGHLASNLGVVELTIALHKVFDAPRDRIVWDVGHQSYVHKLLTGRGASFGTLRQMGGMSGFPKRCESGYRPRQQFHLGCAGNGRGQGSAKGGLCGGFCHRRRSYDRRHGLRSDE